MDGRETTLTALSSNGRTRGFDPRNARPNRAGATRADWLAAVALWLSVCGVLGLVWVATPHERQTSASAAPDTIGALVVEGQARELLTAAWTDKLYQKERGYCVSWTEREDTLVVFAAQPALDTTQVSWDTIVFSCPAPLMALHTHPPQDCNPVGTYCAHTTWREATCAGSEADQLAALADGEMVEVVQCGRDVFGAFFPPRFRPPVRYSGP